ncbi:MAG: DEAD/DEAH box helicase, partial [Flammeovirgaceae bacterium]|nr:DEAD/DEAH box helicase [Flammeovirgaceae bacterium]
MKDFLSSNIRIGIVKYLEEIGISDPTEIQAKTIPVLLKHSGDFVGRSATGTGKTFAFGIPLLSRIDSSAGKIQAVVLVPTRELCEQVGKELIALGNYIADLKIEAIYGGVPLKSQIQNLSNGVHVMVATPGRLMDLIQRKVVNLSTLNFMVFDEADEMLSMGFIEDIEAILNETPTNRQTALFSATLP